MGGIGRLIEFWWDREIDGLVKNPGFLGTKQRNYWNLGQLGLLTWNKIPGWKFGAFKSGKGINPGRIINRDWGNGIFTTAIVKVFVDQEVNSRGGLRGFR